jgi:hypothetical protein
MLKTSTHTNLVAGNEEISNFVLITDLANIVEFLGDPDKIPS